ncbi:MAG TPA: TerC family protein [Bauldia sp.]|nr:TerC family protein [Bauldia sp.]
MDIGIGTSLLQIAWINIVLSGDNAMVIALACRSLRGRERWLGIVLGAAAAVVLRAIFTVGLSEIMVLPFAKLLAGLLLIFIAVKLLVGESDDAEVKGHESLWRAMGAIIVADIIMSLDNVIAIAAAARGSTALIVTGLAISVPIVVFGSTLIVELIKRVPAIVWLGSGFLGWISGETLAGDSAIAPILGAYVQAWVLPAAGVVFVLAAGWVLRMRRSGKQTDAEPAGH